eukprot:gene577-3894_t
MGDESVRVVVRCRPLNKRERDLNCQVVIDIISETGLVQLSKPNAGSDEQPKKFTFDGAYSMESTSKIIYEDVGFPLIENVLEGYNGTVFAYGQTGCGKSFTMEGIPNPPEHRGITPRSFEHIFQEVAVRENTKFLVRASYLEIYNETVRDLLGSDHTQQLELKEHPDKGVYVKGLTEHVVHDANEVLKVMTLGSKSATNAKPTIKPAVNKNIDVNSRTDDIEERIRKEKEEELKAREEKLKQEYDQKLADLEKAVEEQRMTNEKLEQEFERITTEYNIKKDEARNEMESSIEEHVRVSVDNDDQRETRSPMTTFSDMISLPVTNKSMPTISEDKELEVIPNTYVVVNDQGKEFFAVRQAGNIDFLQAVAANDGHLHPMFDETDRPVKLRNAKFAVYSDCKQAEKHPLVPVAAVMQQDGTLVAALIGPEDNAVRASIDHLDCLSLYLNDDDEPVPILSSDGLPVPYIHLQEPCVVVKNKEGDPEVAYVTQEGLAVQCIYVEGSLKPYNDSSGNTIPIIGPDGLAAYPVICSLSNQLLPHRVRAVRTSEGDVVATVFSNDGIPLFAQQSRGHIYKPALDSDGNSKRIDASRDTVVFATADSSVVRILPNSNRQSIQRSQEINKQKRVVEHMYKDGATSDRNSATKDIDIENLQQADIENNPLVAALKAKLQAFEQQLVKGGKAASDESLKEGLKKRHKRAEERRKKIREAITNAEGEDILEDIYDNLQDEIKGKRRQLSKAKEMVKGLKQEIQDIQSEFARERESLLEEIRRSEQERKFYSQYVDHVVPVIRQDCNYANLTKIRAASVWNEEADRWIMPKLTRQKTLLPPGQSPSSERQSSGHSRDDWSGDDEDRFRERLNRGQRQDQQSSLSSSTVLSKFSRREQEIAAQQQQRIKTFEHVPLTSTRTRELLNGTSFSGADRLSRPRQKRHEPGGVSISELSRNRRQHTQHRQPASSDVSARDHQPFDW